MIAGDKLYVLPSEDVEFLMNLTQDLDLAAGRVLYDGYHEKPQYIKRKQAMIRKRYGGGLEKFVAIHEPRNLRRALWHVLRAYNKFQRILRFKDSEDVKVAARDIYWGHLVQNPPGYTLNNLP